MDAGADRISRRIGNVGALWRRALKRPAFALCAVLAVVLSASPARSDEATDLLFFSADLTSGGGFGGAGWMRAPWGLDMSGPMLAAELGRSYERSGRGAAAAGWLFTGHGAYLTLLAGFEVGSDVRPLASADLWWEPASGWMATGRVQATPDYVSWRVAAGLKPAEGWPWLGPEAASWGAEPRAGIHATGLDLPAGFEARVSAGLSWDDSRSGAYGELSLWRRF